MKLNKPFFQSSFRGALQVFNVTVLLMSLCACQHNTEQVIQKTSKSSQAELKDKPSEAIEQLEEKAGNKMSSPDKRLKVFIESLNTDAPLYGIQHDYRVTVLDNEQHKVIFSREFHLKGDASSLSVAKVFNNFFVIELHEENLNQAQGTQEYFAINPDDGQSHRLECPGFKEPYAISDFSETKYQCVGEKTSSPGASKKELVSMPVFLSGASNGDEFDAKQSKSSGNIKAELAPFDTNKGYTVAGKRSRLRLIRDGKTTYEKYFSGKCTGCKWINQDHWIEAFKLEQVAKDKILLTQMLFEVDEEGQVKAGEPLYASILLIPSCNKMIHLDCGEKDDEMAYVTSFNDTTFTCKYLSASRAEFQKNLPL